MGSHCAAPFHLFQVRESSQEVLLMLLEQELIFQHETESKVCPVLPALLAPVVTMPTEQKG